jgi:AraC-like DNA-binding protein
MTQFKFIKILFLLFAYTFLSAQTSQKNFTTISYKKIKEYYWQNEGNQKRQLPIAHAYLIKAKKENNPVEKARGYFLLSLISENNKALCYLDSAISNTKNLNDLKYPAYAYSGKGYVYKKQFMYKEAIDNFLIAESIAKKNNPDLYFETKFSIAALRSEELGEVTEALNLYRQCFDYYKDKKIRNSQYSHSYQLVLFALADAFKALNQTDSATFYNELGYKESNFTKNYYTKALFILNEGANLVVKKKYTVALDSINKALPKMVFYKDGGNTLASYYYTAKAYEGLGNRLRAVENFLKVDSVYSITRRITPEFISGYPYLINYYKKNEEKENQLKYLTKYMHIDSLLQKNYKELTKKLQKEYDTPNLMVEKENLIQSLTKDRTQSYLGIGILFLFTISAFGFGFYQYQMKRKYHFHFEKIIQKETKIVEVNDFKRNKETTENISKTVDIGINDDLVYQILEKLNNFELSRGFLVSSITIQSLSDAFDTNSKYVSKIVNVYKEKTFIQYVNELRIDHAVESLKVDKKIRKYKIQALALEFGFNNAESFSISFYKHTALKPAYFIKQLEEFEQMEI